MSKENFLKTMYGIPSNGSPIKLGAFGRLISGRKKIHKLTSSKDGKIVRDGHIIVDKHGGIVREKSNGNTVRYKKGNRPRYQYFDKIKD
jgi:hypothetical protein